ncbi:hypothetical protein D4R51_02950 [bacterium]|nr:MAG: hypothetical protein D4R51_02950 [bacterium]
MPMENMEQFDPEQKSHRPDYLPQSEAEWLETGKFDIETIRIGEKQIRCALVKGTEGEPLVTMVGGIPRNPERRKKLPLINKLYGHLALKLLDENESSLLYNQPATGGSSGEWENETIQSRTDILVGVSRHFHELTNSSNLSLIGTSAGAYMAVNALEQLENQHIKVPKLVLLSPAAYPKDAEDVPYGPAFTGIVRQPWDIAESPIFPKLEQYIKNGGSVFISFFESDDPPIPEHIQEYYKTFAQRLSDEGGAINLTTIPGVAHNFRRIGVSEGKNVVDNDSIRATATLLADFLK